MKSSIQIFLLLFLLSSGHSQYDRSYLGGGLDQLYRLSDALTRSISPENITGEKGKGGMIPLDEGSAGQAARELGTGWKVNPYFTVSPGNTITMAEIGGPGAIRHIWLTQTGNYRLTILRIYWDDESHPSVEVPVGDFFATAYDYRQISSLPVCVNPGRAFNCYWIMPFHKKCRMTFENIGNKDAILYYQVDYTLAEVPDDAAYFHAQFRRTNPLPYKDVYTIVDNIRGKGQYVGTYVAWQTNSNGWWGEGEVKFYIDGDKEFPTICGTGTEDYFCGSFCFWDLPDEYGNRSYKEFTTPYSGFYFIPPDENLTSRSQTRFGMYRWHITDPVRFNSDIRITMQALGWRSGGRYLPLQDDIASVAYWYQREPHHSFPALPDAEHLEIH